MRSFLMHVCMVVALGFSAVATAGAYSDCGADPTPVVADECTTDNETTQCGTDAVDECDKERRRPLRTRLDRDGRKNRCYDCVPLDAMPPAPVVNENGGIEQVAWFHPCDCDCGPCDGYEPTCGVDPPVVEYKPTTCGCDYPVTRHGWAYRLWRPFTCGYDPEPACGVEPSCGFEPTCGVEPSCGFEPTCGVEPSCGFEPTCGVAAPTCGADRVIRCKVYCPRDCEPGRIRTAVRAALRRIAWRLGNVGRRVRCVFSCHRCDCHDVKVEFSDCCPS